MKKGILIFAIIILFFCQPVFAEELDYYVVPGREYAVLSDEVLTGNNDIIVRCYKIYTGTRGVVDSLGSMYYGEKFEHYVSISLPKSFSSLFGAKKWLSENEPDSLRLLPLTIISEKVFNQWIMEGYKQQNEYWESAPKWLILNDIKPLLEIIPKPFIPESLEKPEFEDIDITFKGEKIKFEKDKPYYAQTGELLVPLEIIIKETDWKLTKSTHKSGQPITLLIKNNNKIEISCWRDYFIYNGNKIMLETRPKLSINGNLLVPWTLVSFL